MDDERQAVDAIATVLSREAVSVASGRIERVGLDQCATTVMLPYVRGIDIRDMYRGILEVTRVDIESQCNDTVATVDGCESIIVDTTGVEEARLVRLGQTPTHRVTFADRGRDGVIYLFPNIDVYVVDTVVTLGGLSAILIVTGRGDIRQLMPGVRSLVLTDINRILSDVIGLMDE